MKQKKESPHFLKVLIRTKMIENSVKYRPIHRLFIANRGEIAVRINRTAKKMGITTIGVITKSEPQTPADEEVFIEGDTLAQTYLNINAIIKAALSKKADAIHPGYGFLSENPAFAEAVKQAGIIFIGPTADVIRQVGDKTNARLLAQSLEIPVTKGFFGTVDEIYDQHKELPYPLLIKAAAGGGGKAMTMVASHSELEEKLNQAEREAERYFGDKTLLVEQFIRQPRHIEVQILADQYGNCIHLYERECSIQRRYQKIIEESPSPFLTNNLREKLTSDALKLCKNIGYENAGTVEFLVDKNGNHYFLEVNARIQVEHPVTEMVTSIDLVKQQLLIAMGLPLMLLQEDIKINGHALECRIYAEDPQNNFHPAPGKVLNVQWPEKSLARTDSWFEDSVEILPNFDPMLAKIITHAPTRLYAIDKMNRALQTTSLMGNKNNIWYLKSILENSEFKTGNVDTSFCETFKTPTLVITSIDSVIAAVLSWQFRAKPKNGNVWNEIGFYRLNKQAKYLINDQLVEVEYSKDVEQLSFSFKNEAYKAVSNIRIENNKIKLTLENNEFQFSYVITPNNELLLEKDTESWKVISYHHLSKNNGGRKNLNSNQSKINVIAPIPGKIIKVNIQEGQQIKAGDTLLMLEAMKMENNIEMPNDGIVKKIFIAQGDHVKANDLLVEIENTNKSTN